jgi:endonuclease YncB( thermonuclease family)
VKVLLATLALTLSLAQAATFTGTVVAVADGDTVTVLTAEKKQHKIRLLGIDAPEKMQPFGRKSKFSLSDMVYLKEVTVDYETQDHYKRYLGKIIVDGKDANLEQIKAGMAWWYRQYKRSQTPDDQKAYADAEAVARGSKVGLWAEKQPVPPWEFRREKR